MAWRKLYFYWLDHHLDGRPPSRANIDPPTEIPGLLPNLMLIDVEAGGFRLRLSGSEITRRAGFDNTGNMIDPDRLANRSGHGLVRLLSRVAETGAPVLYKVGPSATSAFGATILLTPLVDQTGSSVDKILGGVFYDPGAARASTVRWDPGALSELVLADELERTEQTAAAPGPDSIHSTG